MIPSTDDPSTLRTPTSLVRFCILLKYSPNTPSNTMIKKEY